MMEADETFIGKRKYNWGRRQRVEGARPIQTVLHVLETGKKRTGLHLSAYTVADRTKETLTKNIKETAKEGAHIETDGWRGYRGLLSAGFDHTFVEHKHQFVRKSRTGKVHTNTIKSAHSQIKRNARKLNLFVGQTWDGLQPKLCESIFRYNFSPRSWLFCVFYLLATPFAQSRL